MLVLSRKLGERILVPHCDLAVTVRWHRGELGSAGHHSPVRSGSIARSCGFGLPTSERRPSGLGRQAKPTTGTW